MSNLLVVDFDFFFPNPMEAHDYDDPTWQLFDWGHAENEIFLSVAVWTTRAFSFLGNKLPLPVARPPEDGWAGFWSRFQFSEDAAFTFADSNAYAGLIEPVDGSAAFEKVVLFDAHHDSGYGIDSFSAYEAQGEFSCEDWMLEQQRNGTTDLVVRYPQWKKGALDESLPDGVLTRQALDDAQPLEEVFDEVFVCRSGAWVPPWCDRDFIDFINACPLDGTQVDEVQLDRGFDAQQAADFAAKMQHGMVTLDPA